ncbi:uncharacterized protein [Triticum aestivum]|uniref:uncharacterized protein n=1 Tax=Triticum aestivum TaxID=4565 RepID=UPI001D01E249|nr:uncharacterized protein LOC123083857 [Triticum aestivum]
MWQRPVGQKAHAPHVRGEEDTRLPQLMKRKRCHTLRPSPPLLAALYVTRYAHLRNRASEKRPLSPGDASGGAARFVDGRRTPSQWADPNSGRHGEIGRAAGRRRRSNNSRNQHEHRQPAQEAARSLVLVLRPPRRKRGSCEKQRMRLTCVLTNRSSPYIAYPVRPPGPWSRKTMSHFARRAWHVPLPCQKVRRPEPTGRTRGSVFVCISDVSPLYPFCKSTCTHHHANALPPDNCVQDIHSPLSY